jgi:hypothetical protein
MNLSIATRSLPPRLSRPLAIMVLAVCTTGPALGKTIPVFVDGRSGPWEVVSNPDKPFGVQVGRVPNTNLGPTRIRNFADLAFDEGDKLTISYVSGRMLAGASGTVFGVGGLGVPGWPPNTPPCNDAPGCYTGQTTVLGQLLGAFADINGKVIGFPFIVGNGIVAKVPARAELLFLGFNDGWYNDNGEGIKVSITNDCVPDGESTTSAGWDDTRGGNATIHGWKQRLLPASAVPALAFSLIQEKDAGGGEDTCFRPYLAYPPFTAVTPPVNAWLVQRDGTWQYDHVGWKTEVVEYYRLYDGIVPCGARFLQQMQIQCTPPFGPWRDYGPVNLLEADITATTVSSRRGNASAVRRWK